MKAEGVTEIKPNPNINKIRGVLWGAVLGDVIGAFLQFNRNIDEQKIKQAFLIKGGGMHKLQPGQPTDDSQLGYSIGKGLVRGKGQLNLNMIAQQMGNWFLSKPIDVGGTIRNSVPKACNMKIHQAHLCRKGARQNSQQSQSNGTLMAITPLAVWCYRLASQDIVKAVRQFTILIHPNQLVVLSNTFYTLTLTYLLNQPQNTQTTKQNSFSYSKQQILKHNKQSKELKQFLTWLQFIQKSLTSPQILIQKLSPVKKSGWVRIAFTYAIYYLITGKSFRESLTDVLRLKGDSDTNACIAGGLMGAFYGYTEIESQLQAQINIIGKWRPKNVKRPEWLVPGLVVEKLAISLSQISPTELKIIGGSD